MRYLFLLTFLSLISCEKEKKNNLEPEKKSYQVSQGEAFGSTYTIQYEHDKDLSDMIKADLFYFDELISTYRDDSQLEKFNRSTRGIQADSVLLDLVQKCFEFNEKSKGFFDPTVAPLSALYGFNGGKIMHYPEDSAIQRVLAYTGMGKIKIKGDSLIKTNPHTQLNFNAVTGYINDYIALKFQKKGIQNYLIEIGGELYAEGVNSEGRPWNVGIDVPEDTPRREIFTTHTLQHAGLATSGNYRKFHELPDGRKVVHTINPKNGFSQASHLLSVTVIAASAAEADAIATSLMAMGLQKAKEFSQNSSYKILLLFNQNGELKSERFGDF